MIALWILGGLLCVLICIGMIRVTAVAVYDKVFDLTVKIGFFTIKPLEKKDKPPKKAKVKKEKKPSKKKKKQPPKPTFAMIKSAVTTLLPVVLKTLQRLGKGLRFKPVQATFVVAGADDPADAAILYGKISALVWNVMPQLERVADFQNVGLRLDTDYQATDHVVTCNIGISITVGRALAIVAGLAVPAIQWYQGYQKEHKQETKAEPADKAAA